MFFLLQRILTCAATFLLLSAFCVSAEPRAADAPPVQSLRALYATDTEFRNTVDQAFRNMKDPGDGTTNPWKDRTFEDLCAFFNDWYYLVPVNNSPTFDEFMHIKKFTWFYYKNPFGQRFVSTEPGLSWSREFATARGKFMDSPASTASIPKWLADPAIAAADYIIPPEGFASFNEFFIRDLKPGARSIADPANDAVLVSPTDCVLNMINPMTPQTALPTKLGQKLNVVQLLAGSSYAKHFENGIAISCILLPDTYHHYHAVVSGKVVESREDVAGAYWGISDFPAFLNNGNFGYGQSYSAFEHFRRGYFVIETKEYGYVAMVPVGLDTIGSVVFEDKVKKVNPANPVAVGKGEKLGHFAYGGSLVIILIEQGISSVTIPLGQQIGVFQKKKQPHPER